MRKRAIPPVLLLAACTAACTNVTDTPDPATHVSPGTISWYLPKMTVAVDVSYRLTHCPTGVNELPGVTVTDTAITPTPVADLTSRRSLVVENLAGWRTSNQVSVSLYPEGTLKSLGANPQDQTAAIVGNVFKSAAQIAGLVVGAPFAHARAVPAARYGCTPGIAKALNDLQAQQARRLDPKLTDAEATSLNATITRLQNALTYKKTVTIDGNDPPPWDPASRAPRSIALTVADMRAAEWLNPTRAPDDAQQAVQPIALLWKPGPQPPGPALPPSAEYEYREPLRATLTLAPATSPAQVLNHRTIAFAQWGTPRRLPITAPVFTTLDWSYTFAEDGTPTDMKVTTTARGLAASNLLNAATGAAGSAMTGVQSAAKANSQLAQINAQDELVKAKTALITDTNTLKALGGTP